MIFYSAMVNAWSLLYDELYGDDRMTEDNRITPQESDEYDPITGNVDRIEIDVPDFTNFTVGDNYIGLGTDAYPTATYMVDTTNYSEVSIDTSNFDTLNITMPDDPTPGIESNNPRKYKEDEAIKALQDYISTTYGGHYTSKENNVQTLDLIESVGDAEAFCRSNAIKYLSRYDKKGQAKRDILKALHYSLLLYHFSGQLKETTTRGYETF